MCIVELMHWFVVAICEDSRLRVVVIWDGTSMFLRLFRLIQHVAEFLGYCVEIRLFLERAGAFFTVATAAGVRRRACTSS